MITRPASFLYSRILLLLMMAAATSLFAACQTTNLNDTPGFATREIAPDRPGMVAGTGPESQDLNRVVDKTLRSILSTPVIASAKTPPRIVLLPVSNNTRFPVNSNIFLKLLKARLNSEAPGKVVFLARDKMEEVQAERELKRQGAVESNPARMARAPKGADFFLSAAFDGMSQASGGATSDYILYTYKLTDAETDEEVWEEYDQIKKEGMDNVIYR